MKDNMSESLSSEEEEVAASVTNSTKQPQAVIANDTTGLDDSNPACENPRKKSLKRIRRLGSKFITGIGVGDKSLMNQADCKQGLDLTSALHLSSKSNSNDRLASPEASDDHAPPIKR